MQNNFVDILCNNFVNHLTHIKENHNFRKDGKKVQQTLFKDSKLRNYSLKMSNVSISDALNVQVFIKTYHLKSLKRVVRELVSFSLKLILFGL